MGLLQKACLTYELHQELAGVTETGKDPLSPCSHSTIRAEICITVDRSGVLVHAETMDKGHPKIIIPVTEASANRTSSKVAPHPLCEQLRYLLPQNEAHYRA